MFNDLSGQRVLITGSSMGIGLATAQAFARYGAKVCLNGRRAPDNLAQLLADMRANGGEAEFFAADLSRTDECERLVNEFVARFGGIDVLISNAGGLVARKPLEQFDDDFYEAVMDLNVRSAVMMTRFALPLLQQSARESGRTAAVINVGSVSANKGGGTGSGLYGAAKAMLHNIQKNWVDQYSRDGIRFNVVSPGTVDTAFHADKDEAARAKVNATIPMGRFGTAEEMAPSFLFLASHTCSSYITGQVLGINGGQFMP